MLSSFQIALLHTKTYRILEKHFSEILSRYKISFPQWSLLGFLYEQKEGMRIVDLARVLDVEAPFVSYLVVQLEEKQLIVRKSSTFDRRITLISITAEGKLLVPKVEKNIKRRMKILMSNLYFYELLVYKKVLEAVIINDEEMKNK